MAPRTATKPRPPQTAPTDQVARPASSGETITVACKFPSGVTLRLARPEARRIPMLGRPGEFIEDTVYRPSLDQTYVVNGPYRQGTVVTPGGYALTPGIPKDFWEEWLKQNRENSLVKSGAIYAESTRDRAEDRATEQRELRSGYERLDVSARKEMVNGEEVIRHNDPRWPATANPNVTGVTTDKR